MATRSVPQSAEDLLRLGRHFHGELVKGDLVAVTPPGEEHGEIANNVGYLLTDHIRPGKLGKVVVEAGFFTSMDPDSVRGPDVSFFRRDRLSDGRLPRGYGTLPPDLAVEVISPNDTSEDVDSRIQEMLAAGVKVIWVLYPRTRAVHVHDSSGSVHVFKAEDTLHGGNVVPGFACKVATLFDLQD